MNSSDGPQDANSSDGPQDAAEVWGKRVGRGLALIVAAVLLLYFIWSLA